MAIMHRTLSRPAQNERAQSSERCQSRPLLLVRAFNSDERHDHGCAPSMASWTCLPSGEGIWRISSMLAAKTARPQPVWPPDSRCSDYRADQPAVFPVLLFFDELALV